MKEIILGIGLAASLSAFAVDLSKSDLEKYATAVKISLTENGQIKACEKLSFALKSKQAKALSPSERSHAEEVEDYFCDIPRKLSDSDVEGLILSVKLIPTDQDCRNLSFALQADESANVSQEVRNHGDEVLEYLCD